MKDARRQVSPSSLWNRITSEPVPGYYRVKTRTTGPWCAAAIFYPIPVEAISERADIEHRKRLHNIAHFIDAPGTGLMYPPVATLSKVTPVELYGGDDWHVLDRPMALTAHRDGFGVHPNVVWEAKRIELLDKPEHDYLLDLLRYRRKHAPHEPHDPMKAVNLAVLPPVAP